MSRKFSVIVAITLFTVFAFVSKSSAQEPRVFLLDGKLLAERKATFVKKSDARLTAAVGKLERDAEKALKTIIKPVTAKETAPPSGDKKDYISQAPYFWRNPATADGFPYIRKDGERNPEIKRYPDHDHLDDVVATVGTLSTAYFFTGKEEYAARAAAILRLWFLDPATGMNPNLQFAQGIPGLNTGRGIGIIETAQLSRLVDSVGLLGGSKSWTKDDQSALENWFAKYLEWLTTSKNGLDESVAKNNHGVFYDVQVVAFALFVGKTDLARKQLSKISTKRIDSQIEADGRMPLELARTKSWSYSIFNLDAFIRLAEMGDKTGVDLWNYRGKDGRGIRSALMFLAPFVKRPEDWKYKQIEGFEADKIYPLLRRASGKYKDAEFAKVLATVPPTADAIW